MMNMLVSENAIFTNTEAGAVSDKGRFAHGHDGHGGHGGHGGRTGETGLEN